MSIILRPALQVFAERMEMKLQANEHKAGWQECGQLYLFNCCLVELEEALAASRERDRPMAAAECVDAANFLMMLADNYWNSDGQSAGFPALRFLQSPSIEEAGER